MIRIVLLFAFMFNVSSCVSAVNVYSQCPRQQCLAVVDAGSSGSRLHIYAYDLEENYPVNIDEVWSKKITPGFASLEPKQSAVETYLSSLFSDAPVQNIPVHFYATAGMRLLSQEKQSQYYTLLEQWASQQPQWELKDHRTINGQEEAVFGWLAVNYSTGALTQRDSFFGVLDMGGASVQVVFPVQDKTQILESDLVELDVYGKRLTLFAHSFLGLGQTQAANQFLDNPHCFSNGYLLPNGALAAGDAGACQRDISKLINQVHAVNRIIQKVIETNPIQNWHAIGGLPPLLTAQPFHFDQGKFTNRELLTQADSKLCQKAWSEVGGRYDADKENLYTYCLLSSYFYALIVNGYGFNPEDVIHYLPKTNNVNWALGVVLHQQ